MEYLLQVQTTVGEPQWQHLFEVANDDMAVDYAKRVIRHSRMAKAESVLSLELFNITEDKQGGHVASFNVETIYRVNVIKKGVPA